MKDGKGAEENREESYFSLFGLEEKTREKENNEEKNHSKPTNIYLVGCFEQWFLVFK